MQKVSKNSLRGDRAGLEPFESGNGVMSITRAEGQ